MGTPDTSESVSYPTGAHEFLPELCRSLIAEAKDITLKTVIAQNDVLIASLHAGELDLLISSDPQNERDFVLASGVRGRSRRRGKCQARGVSQATETPRSARLSLGTGSPVSGDASMAGSRFRSGGARTAHCANRDQFSAAPSTAHRTDRVTQFHLAPAPWAGKSRLGSERSQAQGNDDAPNVQAHPPQGQLLAARGATASSSARHERPHPARESTRPRETIASPSNRSAAFIDSNEICKWTPQAHRSNNRPASHNV